MNQRNMAASVRARLLNRARETRQDFNLILTRYALERLLYRLSISPHADQFLLKGALLFDLWFDIPHRPTRDADLLGFGSAEIPHVEAAFRDICTVELDDGIRFQPDSVVIPEKFIFTPPAAAARPGWRRWSRLASAGRATGRSGARPR